MNRLTEHHVIESGAYMACSGPCDKDEDACGACLELEKIVDRLAAYEDSGLEPDEVEAAKEIAARLALSDYPHNFQRERSDIVSYMRWITSVMEEAKAWWKKLLKASEDAEKALEGMKQGGYRSERR